MPIPDNTIYHLAHSSFALKIQGRLMVFDYHLDPADLKPGDGLHTGRIVPEAIKDESVLVFASHGHGDHFNPVVYGWKSGVPDIRYILSFDVPAPPKGAAVVRPGDEIHVADGLRVRAYASTDEGVAFSVYTGGKHIYFAGDNAFWNWDGDLADEVYIRTALSQIDDASPMDIAFQVCDPRLKGLGDGGIHIFARKFHPRLLVPIHSFGAYDFNKTAETKLRQAGFEGDFWCVAGPGDRRDL